jgi:organic radical activating enzyme
MDLEKFPLNIVQFYISHTCNIACPGCLSFNNYNISGHDMFADYEHETAQWSKILQPSDMSIIGGEPMSNPDLHNWVLGVRKYFDCTDLKICTNGLLINKWATHIPEWWDLGIVVEVSAHTPAHYVQAQSDIEKIIGNKNIKKVNAKTLAKLNIAPKYYSEDYETFYITKNTVVAMIGKEYVFNKWGVKTHNNNQINFFASNPIAAHNACDIKECHYIYKGELYKCGTIVGAKALIEKYNVEERGRQLIESYKPLQYNHPNLQKQLEVFSQKAIAQCAMCPINHKQITINDSDTKKIKAL